MAVRTARLKLLLSAGLLCAALLFPAVASAAGPRNLTDQCVLTLPDASEDAAQRLTDGSVMTRVRFSLRDSLLLTVPEAARGLYLAWYELPEGARATCRSAAGETLSVLDAGGSVCEYFALPESTAAVAIEADHAFTLSELAVYDTADAPDALHLPTVAAGKTDLLVVAAHAGDEQLDLGGVLPLYAGERGLNAAVVFCSHKNRQAMQDAFVSLQLCGVQTAPVFLGLADRTFTDASDSALDTIWDASDAVAALAGVIRRVQPEVLVTHAAAGENGEGIRALTSGLVQKAVAAAASKTFDPAGVRTFGVWQVKKVYLHQPGDNAVQLDTRSTLSRMGHSAGELSSTAYNTYAFTGVYHRTLDPDGVFTLLSSTVGEDTENNDLFAHIAPEDLTTGGNPPAATPSPAATPAPGGWPTQVPVRPSPTPAPTPDDDAFFRQPGEPEEVVVADDAAGRYEYRSDTLSIFIDRRKTDLPLTYYVAHIRMRGADAFRPGFGHDREGGMTKQSAPGIARRNKAVLLITGDDLTHMEVEKKGILLRNGRYYSGKQAEATMALYPDCSMRIFLPRQTDWQTLLDEGVENAYSFGPVLMLDGEVYPKAYRHRTRERNPRVGLGMVEPGHFVAIAVDGRIKGYSIGLELMDFAELFRQEGCTVAYNLDGGASEAMVFMGEYVNLRAKAHVRTMPDGLMWGYSELVPGMDDPYRCTGVYETDTVRPDK